jgi:hypothetical protein
MLRRPRLEIVGVSVGETSVLWGLSWSTISGSSIGVENPAKNVLARFHGAIGTHRSPSAVGPDNGADLPIQS